MYFGAFVSCVVTRSWYHRLSNGDKHHPGRRFVVHRTLEFECLLDKLTHVLSPAKGFCRMYTPRGGTRVKTTQELESGKQYVAAANERFKPLDYGGIQDPVKQQLQNRHRSVCYFAHESSHLLLQKTGVQLPKIKPRAVRSGRAKRLANYGTKTVWSEGWQAIESLIAELQGVKERRHQVQATQACVNPTQRPHMGAGPCFHCDRQLTATRYCSNSQIA